VNDELASIWKEDVVTYIKVRHYIFPSGVEEN